MNHEEYARMFRFEDTYWWFLARRHLIVALLETFYPRDTSLSILDIGCGTGAMLDELAPFGRVTGADFSPEALAFCRTRGDKYPLTRADVRRLPFADSSFDVVTAMDIIEHIDDDKAASSEIFRVLKPGGRLFVSVPAFPSLWSEHDEALHHFRRYTAPSLKDVFQRVGFRISRLSYTITSLFPIVFLYRQIANLLPKKTTEKRANLVKVNKTTNAILRKVCEWETRQVANGNNFPLGVTVVCVAEKAENVAEKGKI